MQRSIVALALIFIVFGLFLFFRGCQNAYEILPVQPSTQLDEEINEGWKEYESQEGGFKAHFPREPLDSVENVRVPDTRELRLYKTFVSETPEGKVYMVSVVTFSDEAYKLGNDSLMRRFVTELAESKDTNRLEKIEISSFKNKSGYDFTIKNPNAKMDGVVFMQDKTLYLLTEIVPKGVDSSDFEKFKEKFELAAGENSKK